MSNVHIISDLFLGYNEFSSEEEAIPESTDLVIFNGNLGHLKRGMLYVETLCRKYPDVQFVYNLGQTEKYQTFTKNVNEVENSLAIRKSSSPTWPKNLHWDTNSQIIKLRNGKTVDVMCKYGFPKIHKCNIDWENTVWYKDHVMDVIYWFDSRNISDKPKETSDVAHGGVPIFATIDWINQQHEKEWLDVKKWEITPTCYKILITHINPFKDTRCYGLDVSPYLIHLYNGLWISSNTVCEGINFLGGDLYSNPGRGSVARSKIVEID